MREMGYNEISNISSLLKDKLDILDIANKEIENLTAKYNDDVAYIKRRYCFDEVSEEVSSLTSEFEYNLKIYLFNIVKNLEDILKKEVRLGVESKNSPIEKILKKMDSLGIVFSSCSFDYSLKKCQLDFSNEYFSLNVFDNENKYNIRLLSVPANQIPNLSNIFRPLILDAFKELESIEGKQEEYEYALYLKLKEKFEDL